MRKRRGVRRGHGRHDRSRPTASVDGEWRPARTSFRVRDENRLEGRLFGPQGRMPPIGLWAVGANEPHARDKTVHGRRRRRMAVNADKFPCSGRKPSRGAFIRSTGVDAAHRAVAVGTDEFPRSGRKPPDPHIRPDAIGFDGQWWRAPSPLANDARITCNTYSVPYKRKDLKKRLSPKSPNTLIHQCITFHTFLIFQYLSLWKSVFSRN